jgi:hypothetical protein
MRKGLVLGAVALVAVAGAAYGAADYFANAKLEERAAVFARDMGKFTREFRYGSVRASIIGHSLEMRDVEFVTLDGDRIKAERVTVKDFDWRNRGRPRYADFYVTRAEVPSTALTNLARASDQFAKIIGVSTAPARDVQRLLDRAGYRRTVSDFQVKYRYDEDTQELEIHDVLVEIAELGTVVFNLKLGNVPADGIRDEAALMSAAAITLNHASLAFRDRTLVSRMLRAYATERGISEAEALARVLAEVKAERDRSRDPIEREALEALLRFIERPGEISVALKPERPVALLGTISRLFGAKAFKNTFGLTITAR